MLAQPLDWTSALDLDHDGQFGDRIDLERLLDSIPPPDDPTPTTDLPPLSIDFDRPLLQAAGAIELRLKDFVSVQAKFIFEKTTLDVVRLDDDPNGETLPDAQVVRYCFTTQAFSSVRARTQK